MSNALERSWSAFSPEIAKRYLDGYGHPSLRSKELLGDLLLELAANQPLKLAEIGCGNGQLLSYFRERKLACSYVGVDFSSSLLAAARERFAGDDTAQFIHDDAQTLDHVRGHFDFVIYSHVIEILSDPELSLRRASKLAPHVIIRFFEPPVFDTDTVELREMEVGNGVSVPYLRRKMSRDFYRLILANSGCTRVDVYQADGDKDQIHLLRYRG